MNAIKTRDWTIRLWYLTPPTYDVSMLYHAFPDLALQPCTLYIRAPLSTLYCVQWRESGTATV